MQEKNLKNTMNGYRQYDDDAARCVIGLLYAQVIMTASHKTKNTNLSWPQTPTISLHKVAPLVLQRS